MLVKNRSLLQKIDKYCNGVWKPNKTDEFKFLSNGMLKKITGHNKSMNTGKLSEWYVGEILRKKGINYTCQPVVKYNLNKTILKNNIQPKTVIKLGSNSLKDKITRITRSSVNGRVNVGSCRVQARTQSGSSSFTGPLTRSKARLLQKKHGKLTKDTKDTIVPVLYRPERTRDPDCVRACSDLCSGLSRPLFGSVPTSVRVCTRQKDRKTERQKERILKLNRMFKCLLKI